MFASLKNKIREETGNDPTRITSGVFKGRTASLSDLQVENKPRLSGSVSSDQEKEENDVQPTYHAPMQKTYFDKATENKEDGYRSATLTSSVTSEQSSRNHNSRIEQQESINCLDNHGENSVIPNLNDADEELRDLKLQLLEANRQIKESNGLCAQLSQSLMVEKSDSRELRAKVVRLEDDLNEQTRRVDELSLTLEKELCERDVMLLRNAQLNQDLEFTRKDIRSQEQEALDLNLRLAALESAIAEKNHALESLRSANLILQKKNGDLEASEQSRVAATAVEQELRKTIAKLEEQLSEKVKSLRVLQLHVSDLKKTLQKELKQTGDDSGDSLPTTAMQTQYPLPGAETDVNFKYLKHVIMKFLTSREYEAQHLTRAVSTLLKFTPEEERLLRETLDWKMSWFGTRPRLGFGQTSKTIPPS